MLPLGRGNPTAPRHAPLPRLLPADDALYNLYAITQNKSHAGGSPQISWQPPAESGACRVWGCPVVSPCPCGDRFPVVPRCPSRLSPQSAPTGSTSPPSCGRWWRARTRCPACTPTRTWRRWGEMLVHASVCLGACPHGMQLQEPAGCGRVGNGAACRSPVPQSPPAAVWCCSNPQVQGFAARYEQVGDPQGLAATAQFFGLLLQVGPFFGRCCVLHAVGQARQCGGHCPSCCGCCRRRAGPPARPATSRAEALPVRPSLHLPCSTTPSRAAAPTGTSTGRRRTALGRQSTV